jgi:hypothetical protein
VIPRCLGWSLFALIMGFFLGGSFFWGLYGPNTTMEQANAAYEKQFSRSPMTALLNEHPGLVVSGGICAVSLLLLVILVALIWQGTLRGWIGLDQFLRFRKYLAFGVMVYAIWCVYRLIVNVAPPRPLSQEFVYQLIFFSIFWVLAPPIWFFVEYFAVASDWIGGLPENKAD